MNRLSEIFWDDETTAGAGSGHVIAEPGGDPFKEPEKKPEPTPPKEPPQPEPEARTEPVAEKEPPVEKEPKHEESQSDIGEADIKSAERWGVTAEEAKAFGSKAELERFTAVLVRRLATQPASTPSASAQAPPNQPPKPEEKKESAPAPQAQQSFNIIEYEPSAEMADYSPEVHKELVAMSKHYKAQLEAQVQAILPHLDSNNNGMAQVFNLALMPRYERAISSLGPEYEPYLGKGDIMDLDPASDQFKLHQRIFATAENLRKDCAARGQSLSLKESWVTAAKALLFDKTKEIVRKAAETGNAPKRKGTTLRKPTRPGVSGGYDKLDSVDDLLEAARETPDDNGSVERLAIY